MVSRDGVPKVRSSTPIGIPPAIMLTPMNAMSQTNSAISSATYGINTGLSNLSNDAQAVASNGPDVGAMVDASQQRIAIEAAAKTLAVANQTLGSLIDLFA
jgi:hypothetical protein